MSGILRFVFVFTLTISVVVGHQLWFGPLDTSSYMAAMLIWLVMTFIPESPTQKDAQKP